MLRTVIEALETLKRGYFPNSGTWYLAHITYTQRATEATNCWAAFVLYCLMLTAF